MKSLLFFGWLFVIQASPAQTPDRTKIYLFNAGPFGSYQSLLTTWNAEKPIDILAGTYALVELDADSLDLLIDRDPQPRTIHFKRGNTYYFLTGLAYGSPYRTSEITEREFWLTVSSNASRVRKPKSYSLSPKSGLRPKP